MEIKQRITEQPLGHQRNKNKRNSNNKKTNLKKNENKKRKYQNLLHAAKAVLSKTFIAKQTYLRKQEKSQSKFTHKGTRKRRINQAQE